MPRYAHIHFIAERIVREHVKNIIDFEKKKILPLTKEGLKSHQDAKVCYICGKRILSYISPVSHICDPKK